MWQSIAEAIDDLVEAASSDGKEKREFELGIARRKLVERIDELTVGVRRAARLEAGLL